MAKRIIIAVGSVILIGTVLFLYVYTGTQSNTFSPPRLLDEYQVTVNGEAETVNKKLLEQNMDQFFKGAEAVNYYKAKFAPPFQSDVVLSPEEQYIWLTFGLENPYQELENVRGKTTAFEFDGETFAYSIL